MHRFGRRTVHALEFIRNKPIHMWKITLMNYVKDQWCKSCQRENNDVVCQLGSMTSLLICKASNC